MLRAISPSGSRSTWTAAMSAICTANPSATRWRSFMTARPSCTGGRRGLLRLCCPMSAVQSVRVVAELQFRRELLGVQVDRYHARALEDTDERAGRLGHEGGRGGAGAAHADADRVDAHDPLARAAVLRLAGGECAAAAARAGAVHRLARQFARAVGLLGG